MENLSKQQLKKNSLDMRYKFLSQQANIWLTLGTITLLGFFTTMMIQKQYQIGFTLGGFIFLGSFFMYKSTKREMEKIIGEIEKL